MIKIGPDQLIHVTTDAIHIVAQFQIHFQEGDAMMYVAFFLFWNSEQQKTFFPKRIKNGFVAKNNKSSFLEIKRQTIRKVIAKRGKHEVL